MVGDVAFCVSLLAGQGAALAMISAYVLAGELAVAQGQYGQAFGQYEALLRSYIAAKQRGAVRFAEAFAPKTQVGILVRNLVVRAFAVPGLAKLAVARALLTSCNFPITDGRPRSIGPRPILDLELRITGGLDCGLIACRTFPR
jgi:2-polyprenyl-6-methoxyphenol hydroxylase-like FAD-dependent oxidoreductase